MATELVEKIIKQIEYYFGDINLSKDKFLRDLTGKEDGWIPISTLLTFNRLKTITEKESDIVDAFEDGKSEIIELNETKDKLRRSKPLADVEDEEYKKEYRLRTVHLKGFPREGITLDDLIEYSSQYGPVESVQMRRFEDKTFKGCCMTTFKSIESANKAISSNDLFKGETELKLRENKETYLKRKKVGKKGEFKKEKRLNMKQNKDDAEKNDDQEEKNNVDINDNKDIEEQKQEEKVQNQEISEQKNEKTSENELNYEEGCIVKFINLPEDIKYWQIKNVLKAHALIKFVDLFPEKKTAIARFGSKNETNKALEALNYKEKDAEKVETSEDGQIEENKTKSIEENDETEGNETKSSEENGVEVLNNQMKVENQIVPEKNGNLLKIKIDDNTILDYIVLKGVEEKEYWLKFKNFNHSSRDSNNKNHHKKQHHNRRFGGYKNNKRPSNNDRNNSKRVKSSE